MKFKLKQDSKHMIHAEEVGSAEAYSMFLKMLNPKSREKNFTWDKLQGMVLAEIDKHLFVHYNSVMSSKSTKNSFLMSQEK